MTPTTPTTHDTTGAEMPTAETTPIVQVEGVSRHYGTDGVVTRALDGIDLVIERGEFTAMAGPSGSGKSTLLNLIGALDTPSSGRITIDGVSIAGLSRSEQSHLRRDHIGFVFQNYNLVPVMTAMENAEYVLMLRGVDRDTRRQRVAKVLASVGLEGMEDRFPRQLSGGQQQRVAIARALVAEPALILADEPTANVDSTTAIGLVDLMLKLHEERGATFLLATHDLRVMRRAQRLLWLEDGRIAYDGPPSGFDLPQ